MFNVTNSSAINDVRYYSSCLSCPVSTAQSWQWPPTARLNLASGSSTLYSVITNVVATTLTPGLAIAPSQSVLTVVRVTAELETTQSSGVVTTSFQETSALQYETVSRPDLPAQLVTSASYSSQCGAESSLFGPCASEPTQTSLALTLTSTVQFGPYLELSSTFISLSVSSQQPSITSISPAMESQTFNSTTLNPTTLSQETANLSSMQPSTHFLTALQSISSTSASAMITTRSASSAAPTSSATSVPALSNKDTEAGFIIALTFGTIFTIVLIVLLARCIHRCRAVVRDESGMIGSEQGQGGPQATGSNEKEISLPEGLTPPPYEHESSTPLCRSPALVVAKIWPLNSAVAHTMSQNLSTAHPLRGTHAVLMRAAHSLSNSSQSGAERDQANGFLVPPALLSPWSMVSSRTSATTISRISYDSHGQRRQSNPFDLEDRALQ